MTSDCAIELRALELWGSALTVLLLVWLFSGLIFLLVPLGEWLTSALAGALPGLSALSPSSSSGTCDRSMIA